MTMAPDGEYLLLASYAAGPAPTESKEIILGRARALWRQAQSETDPTVREGKEAEAWALAESANTPSKYSTAARSERIRLERMLRDDS